MKRFVIVAVALGLTVGSLATAEAKMAQPARVERTVEASYGPPYLPPVTGCHSLLGPWACLVVATRPTEEFFTAEVTDAHGRPVFVSVISDYRTIATFCGETRRPIPFNPGSDVQFRIGIDWPGQLDCPANRVKTIGTISVTLSNLP